MEDWPQLEQKRIVYVGSHLFPQVLEEGLIDVVNCFDRRKDFLNLFRRQYLL